MENNKTELKQKEPFVLTKKYYILFGLLFCTFFIGLLFIPINGDDYWWHIKIGEWIIQNKQFPMTGLYSWYALENNLSWFAHEWLAEVVLYGFTVLFGENGGIYYLLITLLSLGFLLYYFNYKELISKLHFSCFWWFIGFFAIGTVSTARPHMLTLSLFIILIYVCEKIRKDDNYNKYYFFSIIALIWANYHGGSSSLVYIIPIIYLITNSFNFKFGRLYSKKIKKPLRYLKLAIVNTLTLFINPRTYQLLYYPYSYTDEHAKYISEWQSPSYSNALYIILIIIFVCLVFFITRRNLNFSDLAIIGAFMLLTLKSVRFIPWLFIVFTMVGLKYVKDLKDISICKYLSYEFGILGIALLFLIGCQIKDGETYITKSLSDETIEILKTEEYDRLCNYYDYGSYLVYKDIPVFIDGRADMYSGYNFKQHTEGLNFDNDYMTEDFINEFNFDMYCIPSNCYLASELRKMDNIEEIYCEITKTDDEEISEEDINIGASIFKVIKDENPSKIN